MNIDDVRGIIDAVRQGCTTRNHLVILADFADAVLNPPMPVRVAMEYRAENPMRDNPGPNAVIADWIVSLTTPTAETPK